MASHVSILLASCLLESVDFVESALELMNLEAMYTHNMGGNQHLFPYKVIFVTMCTHRRFFKYL